MLSMQPQDSAASLKTSPVAEPVYRNSVPVAVLLVPVIPEGESQPRGLLTVVRGIEPAKGKQALPGGFVEEEVWQDAAVRELREETGIIVSPKELQLETIESVQNGRRLLIFSKTNPISINQVPEGFTSNETEALKVIYEPEEMAFSTHTEMVRRFFAALQQQPQEELQAAVFTPGEHMRIEELARQITSKMREKFGAGDWASVDNGMTINGIIVHYTWRREGSNWGWSDYETCSMRDGRSSVMIDIPDLQETKVEEAGIDPAGMLRKLLQGLK